jgi:hypothetical protein
MKELVHSRAYLRFTDPQDVLRFTHQLDGHAFLTERGTQFRCDCTPVALPLSCMPLLAACAFVGPAPVAYGAVAGSWGGVKQLEGGRRSARPGMTYLYKP